MGGLGGQCQMRTSELWGPLHFRESESVSCSLVSDSFGFCVASLVAQTVKRLPAMQETRV